MDMNALQANYERKRRVLTARPSAAREAATATGRLDDALGCEIRSGTHVLFADGGANEGGPNRAPSPGQMMRSALIGCLAIGYRVWAGRFGITLDSVEVEMTCHIDARGQLGIAEEVPARWLRIEYTVRITSPAGEAELRDLVDHADRLSPMFGCLDKEIVVERTLDLRGRP